MLFTVINGLTLGALYALIALGYTMVYGILELINFAHGEVMMFGAFFYFSLILYGCDPVTAALLAVLGAALLGVLIERIAYRPLRNSPRLAPLISAIGVSIFLQNLAMWIWGTRPSAVPVPEFLSGALFSVGEGQVPVLNTAILLVTILIMVTLVLFIKRTRMGKAMRAASQDRQAAQLMGINSDRIISLTFFIGSALAAVAGIFYAMYFSVKPTMGFTPGIKAFTAAVLGGIGNVPGAMLGGFLLGLLESLGGAYVSTEYQNAIAFFVLILVLLLRPAGLLGRRRQEKV